MSHAPHALAAVDSASPLRGVFRIVVKDRLGRVVLADEDRNMIVNGAQIALAELLGEAKADKVVARFGVGVGSASATPADEGLTEAYLRPVDGHDYPEPGVVRFLWSLGYGEGNGKAVTEFGLFCADGSLFARKVRDAIAKADDLCFEGEWSIIF